MNVACIAHMHLIISRCIYTILVIWKKSCDMLSMLHIWTQQKNTSYIYKASKDKQLNERNMVNPISIFKVTSSQLSTSHIRSYIPNHICTWQYSWHHLCYCKREHGNSWTHNRSKNKPIQNNTKEGISLVPRNFN